MNSTEVFPCLKSAVIPSKASCLQCRSQDDTYLYGIFDTHNGTDEARFVLQGIAAEILLGQLTNKNSDEEIKDVLRNAFISVEKAYNESIDALVAERTCLQFDLPDDLDKENTDPKYSEILERLKKIDEQLSVGITSVITLLYKKKLFVANIGNSRALLCKTDDNGVLRVVQLSVDHSLSNEDELLRLSKAGLNIDNLRKIDLLGNQSSTRCIGNYLIKALYKAFPDLSDATNEPIISIPEVHGPITLDDSCRFLVLMSDKLYKNLQEAIETDQVNKQLVQMIVEQFRVQTSLEAVCQIVVEKIYELHNEYCNQYNKTPWSNHRNTLLIRNFNFPLPNQKSPNAQKTPVSELNSPFLNLYKLNSSPTSENKVKFNPIVENCSPSELDDVDMDDSTDSQNLLAFQSHNSTNSDHSNQSGISTITEQFSQESPFHNTSSTSYSQENDNKLTYDNEKIDAYVDFSPYYENLEITMKNGTLPPNFNLN